MTITPESIASTIETAPAWALLALTAPVERLREDGRREIAQHVYSTLYRAVDVDRAQLALPLR
jgi:hypothetical protein